jgi:Na+/H+ antiporter NhaC
MSEEVSSDAAEQDVEEKRAKILRIVGFVISVGVLLLALPSTQPEPSKTEALTAQVAMRKDVGGVDDGVKAWVEKHRPEQKEKQLSLKLDYHGPELGEEVVRRKLAEAKHLTLSPDGEDGELDVAITTDKEGVQQEALITLEVKGEEARELSKNKRRLGTWVSVLPPLIAVLFALFFKRLILALFGAVWLGAAIQAGFMPHTATWDAIVKYMLGSTFDGFNLHVIGFTLSLVGMVHVILRMGGMAGLLDKLRVLATSRRASKLTTALMGGAIFFDDYANTIVVGTTMRPMTDARKISREKLAYLVDSTSAPIAGVAIISTWIGYEVGLFDELSRQLSIGMSGYEIFFSILAMRFYCLLTLVFVLLNAVLERDFGPMLTAERRASSGGGALRPGSKPLTQVGAAEHISPPEGTPSRWFNAVIPVSVVILSVMLGMYWSGWASGDASLPGLGALMTGEAEWSQWSNLGAALSQMGSWEAWRDAFSNADNAKVLFYGAIMGSVVAILLAVTQRLLNLKDASIAWARAIPGMWMAVAILVLAWSIRAVCDDLGTSVYLVGAVQDLITPTLLPIITFVLAAIIAFATGTSWGTMGILIPALIPLAHHMTQGQAHGEVILMLCFAAVLDGAIFGDHCSPISDTTVMSSIASACDHIDHVRTQAPYAITTMLAASTCGYLGVAYGLPVWGALVLGVVSLAAVLFLIGRALPEVSIDEEARDQG